MTDAEIRMEVLRAFYERRNDNQFGQYQPKVVDFQCSLTWGQIFRICEQLQDHGLIKGAVQGSSSGGYVIARITAHGCDVIEGTARPTIAITHVNNSVNISNSTNVQGVIAGSNNTQTVERCVAELVRVIDSTQASAEQKAEAKGMLRKLLEHPLLAALAGGAVGLL